MRDPDLLTMPMITDFLELIQTYWDTTDPPDVVTIWKFDGMADMLTIVGDRSICSLSPIYPYELEGVPCTDHLLRNIHLDDGHGVIRVVLERIELPVDLLIHRNTDNDVYHFCGIYDQWCL